LVDTEGLLHKVVVHAASVQDRSGAFLLLYEANAAEKLPLVRTIRADNGYWYSVLQEWVKEEFGWEMEVVLRQRGVRGFQALPGRWVVERTFAWLGKYRRLSKDYEFWPASSEAYIYLAMSHIMLRRLCPPTPHPPTWFLDTLSE
jgi:putative transposase